ncbi:hypothetical protein ACIPEL_39360 [Streptomyces griseoviridis]
MAGAVSSKNHPRRLTDAEYDALGDPEKAAFDPRRDRGLFHAPSAAANHVSDADLRELLGVRMLKRTPLTVLIEPLSIVTGFEESVLCLALPEFGPGPMTNEPGHFGRPLTQRKRSLERPACRRCVHAAGIQGPVNRWTTHEQSVFLRHRLWIGEGCTEADDQVDISDLSSTSKAQRHHRNRIPRHGRRWVRDAFSGARTAFIGLSKTTAPTLSGSSPRRSPTYATFAGRRPHHP